MNNPREIQISEYSYTLPEDRIAHFPLPERDQSKLLIFKQGHISESNYYSLAEYLPKGACMVFNNTRVMEARLLFKKPTGGMIEIFILEPGGTMHDLGNALHQKGKSQWKCLVGGASKWKHGMILEMKATDSSLLLKARIVSQFSDSFLIEFSWQPEQLDFIEVIHQLGNIPLPPYLKREAEESDKERYQTVYSKTEGSVAAPTAGLHFTERMMEKLRDKHIEQHFVTLHVGAGTFKPVKSKTMEHHEMHAEYIDVDASTILELSQKEHIYAVGTTSLRTLESLYILGVYFKLNPEIHSIPEINQWDPYSLGNEPISREDAFICLYNWLTQHGQEKLITKTSILIAPGYKPKTIKGVITNFHQPNSTLLLLVAALIGDEWNRVYQYALDHEFRFLSYGDGCLLEP